MYVVNVRMEKRSDGGKRIATVNVPEADVLVTEPEKLGPRKLEERRKIRASQLGIERAKKQHYVEYMGFEFVDCVKREV